MPKGCRAPYPTLPQDTTRCEFCAPRVLHTSSRSVVKCAAEGVGFEPFFVRHATGGNLAIRAEWSRAGGQGRVGPALERAGGRVGRQVAEGVGFEPTEACASLVFKTSTFVRSVTPPGGVLPDWRRGWDLNLLRAVEIT